METTSRHPSFGEPRGRIRKRFQAVRNASHLLDAMTERFSISRTPLDGLLTVCRHPRHDDRGYLDRLFCLEDLSPHLTPGSAIVQVNRTLTRTAGMVRGMHFQRPPHAELKIVTCLRGSVFDVAVDVRTDSPSQYQWHGVVLSAEAANTVIIPQGFAHGFQTLSSDCELLYFHTAAWNAKAEAALHPLDPALAITWPRPVSGMSDRDRNHPFIQLNPVTPLPCAETAA